MSHEPMVTLRIHQEFLPLNDAGKRAVVAWLRQMAGEFEAGEHWGHGIFVLEYTPSSNGHRRSHQADTR